MEGIPFIIVEHVPKGESGAERNRFITGLLGPPFLQHLWPQDV